DRETASKLSDNCDKTQLYRELASAAESGWDFSTRWMRNESDLATLATTSIIPVDLNVFILKTGFGWSNGVVLAFLEEFGWPEDLKLNCSL
ncbi:UNVERIFIED_CONTAM: Trehalase, partial [Sesamum latifolium]